LAYIGNDPKVAFPNYKNIDDISGSFNSSTTSFALLVSGAAPSPLPLNSQQCLISVGGVLQRPDDTGSEGFRLSGGNIVFSSAPATGADFFGVILAGADYVNVGANFPDGSAAVPSITFSDDSDTGFFRSSSGAVSFSSNAVSSAIFGANSFTAPSFIPTSSSVPTNGIFLPSANTVSISTNSTERFKINGTGEATVLGGNLTLNAQGDLRFADSDSSNFIALQAPATISSNVTLTLPSADGSNGQVLTTNGSGTLSFTTPAATSDKITEGNTEAEVVDTGSNGHFKVTTEGTERFRINSSGNCGIGTASPATTLDVNGDVTITDKIIHSGDTNTAIRFPAADTVSIETNSLERARIASDGRVLIGTSTSVATGGSPATTQIFSNSTGEFLGLHLGYSANAASPILTLSKSRNNTYGSYTIVQNNDGLGRIFFAGDDGTDYNTVGASIEAQVDGTPGANDMPGRLVFSTTADGAASPTERMRIANTGQVLVNTTSTLPHFIFNLRANSDGTYNPMVIQEDAASGSPARQAINFYRTSASASVGNISTTNSATSYNTSSDYRLKINVVPVIDGIARLQQLKPSRFNFIASPNCVVDGFLAHEVQTVVPEAITGEKDAVDGEGNPVYQGIDQSKLVPLLTAALQEAVAKIESLEARLTAAGI